MFISFKRKDLDEKVWSAFHDVHWNQEHESILNSGDLILGYTIDDFGGPRPILWSIPIDPSGLEASTILEHWREDYLIYRQSISSKEEDNNKPLQDPS